MQLILAVLLKNHMLKAKSPAYFGVETINRHKRGDSKVAIKQSTNQDGLRG